MSVRQAPAPAAVAKEQVCNAACIVSYVACTTRLSQDAGVLVNADYLKLVHDILQGVLSRWWPGRF